MAAAFEHVEKADDVAAHVGVGVLQRVAHPGLRRQVDGPVEGIIGEDSLHGLGVGEVEALEVERVEPFELLQPGLLEGDVVVVVEVVDTDHCGAAFEETAGDVHPDEAGGTGDEDVHATRQRTRGPGALRIPKHLPNP